MAPSMTFCPRAGRVVARPPMPQRAMRSVCAQAKPEGGPEKALDAVTKAVEDAKEALESSTAAAIDKPENTAKFEEMEEKKMPDGPTPIGKADQSSKSAADDVKQVREGK